MKEQIVTSQAQLDAIPVDFDGRIIIKFGTPFNRAVVDRRFLRSVKALENSSVVARGNSSVVAWGNSSVVARENSSVVARGNSSVEAWGNSSVVARENSSVVARENSSVVARENSSVEAWGNSSVEALGNSSVVAWGNSSVEALGNSSVEALENSSVVARGNSQIADRQRGGKIELHANARAVKDPSTIREFIDSIGDLEETETTVRLFKAVHKRDDVYFSDNDNSFRYYIGGIAEADGLSKNPEEDCGHGIHMADKSWCVAYGRGWKDLAIIEVEADKDGIVVPLYGVGKVRARSVKVIREVPLEECGILGKQLAKRRAAE